VTVLENFRWNQNSLAHVCYDTKLEIVRGDARDERVVKPLVEWADLIVPLAALVGAPLCDANKGGAISTNYHAVESLCRMTSKPIIFPNTNSGYGSSEEVCTEWTPLKPISLYGKTKAQAEDAVMVRGNAICFRLATVFGMSPRMRIDLLVNNFVYRAVNDRAVVIFEGHFKRNYISIHDVARVFLHAIDNFSTMKDQVYNVGLSNANLTKMELCDHIKFRIPSFVFVEERIGEDIDKRNYIVSNDKIEAAGFRPMFLLDDGIVELIKGYRMLHNSRYGNA
jgi:nucleoside-diphosphate-sugar epimerase